MRIFKRKQTAEAGRWRVLPAFLLMLALGFGIKIGNVYTGMLDLTRTAVAQEAPPADIPPADAVAGGDRVASAAPPPIDDPIDDPAALTRSEIDLLQDLMTRREELDQRTAALELRERLLAETERRIDGKIAALKALEGQISDLLVTHEEYEEAQLASIVAVYAKMKPKDAARIFQRLDIAIQLEVATRMKESKMAAILAAMSPDLAKTLTSELAARAKVPTIDSVTVADGS